MPVVIHPKEKGEGMQNINIRISCLLYIYNDIITTYDIKYDINQL